MGYIFELLAHDAMREGGDFSIRCAYGLSQLDPAGRRQ